jgi:hypothetical protein
MVLPASIWLCTENNISSYGVNLELLHYSITYFVSLTHKEAMLWMEKHRMSFTQC